MRFAVGVAITTIPPRAELLERAKLSVVEQNYPCDRISIACDWEHRGAAVTRNRAWRALGDIEYVAFLDDDDEMKPEHLARLVATAEETEADLVYPWFDVVGGTDPFPMHFGVPWDPAHPHQTTVTVLWRRAALEAVGGFRELTEIDDEYDHVDPAGNRIGEDYLAVLRLNEKGGLIVHLPERTWLWHHDSGNTSGMPDRW